MDSKVVAVWMDDNGWCVTVGNDPKVYVYGTMRSALNKVERTLKELYKGEAEGEE